MVPRKRIFLTLLQDMVAYKRLKLFRYYVGIMFLDNLCRGEGRLEINDEVIDTFTNWCQVKRETVVKNLNHLEKHGYGKLRNGYFYYASQEQVANRYAVKLDKRAIVFYLDDMRGDGVHWRAVCTDKSCADGLNMSRAKRHSVYHQAPKTQRKYEAEANTTVVENYLDLGDPANEQVVAKAVEERSNFFVLKDHEGKLGESGADHLMSRTVNTYQSVTTPLEKRRIKSRKVSINEMQGPDDPKRLFFKGDATIGGYEKASRLHRIDPSVDRFVLKTTVGNANYYNVLGRKAK